MNGKSAQKVNGKSGHVLESEIEPFAMLVESVLYDKELSLAARCVYSFLTRKVWPGTVAKIGQRKIAKLLGVHQETVSLALKELAARRHIVTIGEGKARRMYHLTSNRFGLEQRALDEGKESLEIIVSSPRPRLATVRPRTA